MFEHLEAGGSPTATDARGTSLLQWCSYHGDASAVRYLLRHGATLDDLGLNAAVEARDANGDTPLGWGSWYLRPREILKLLVHGRYRV